MQIELEKGKNAETYSDIARCIYEMGDKEQMQTEGLKVVDEALKINQKCHNAWLNKGNICHFLEDDDQA